jgi:cytoskeletal protein CcmA (bactofilin family)
MLDNFRRRDLPRSTRVQAQYSRLQEALNSAGADSTREDAFRIEAPEAELRDDPQPSRSGGESVSKLIVGPDIKLKGAEITDCDTLVVEGRVEASMDSRVIQIAEHGVFVGKAGIDIAEIRGRFEGELTARKQLVIRATGKVSGKVRYGKVAIEEGGEISGDIAALPETKGAGAARASETARSATAPPATPVLTQAGAQPLPGKPAWTSQGSTQPHPSKPAGAPQAGAQAHPSKPAGAPQAGAQPHPNKPAGAPQAGAQPQPSKPTGASQAGAQPQPSKPAGVPH